MDIYISDRTLSVFPQLFSKCGTFYPSVSTASPQSMERASENDSSDGDVDETQSLKITKSAKRKNTTANAPKRDAILARLSTPELARKAMSEIKTEWNPHDLPLDNDALQPLWCAEKIDVKGNRHEIPKGDRAGRPMINVQDGPEEMKHKDEARKSKAADSGTKLRNSKNAAANGMLVTYTKYLATHVQLFAAGRPVPSNGNHASHLCHNERCIRSTHIRVESGALNQRRKGCAGVLVCRNCMKIWHICNHHPVFKCLTVTLFVCCGESSQQVAQVIVPEPVDEVATSEN